MTSLICSWVVRHFLTFDMRQLIRISTPPCLALVPQHAHPAFASRRGCDHLTRPQYSAISQRCKGLRETNNVPLCGTFG